MKKRLITSVVYVIVMVGLLALKWQFPTYGSIGIDVLFWAISVMGAYEFMRAVGDISRTQRVIVLITCALIVPSFVITKMVSAEDVAAESSLTVLLGVISLGMTVVASLMVFDFERSSLSSTAYAEFAILYCGALGSVGSNINHLAVNSLPAIVLLFFIPPAVDTFAFLTGSLLGKKFPHKLAPHTSPNKTTVGAIGGMLGGLVAATLAWVVCAYLPNAELTYEGSMHELGLLMLISVITSVFSQLGDLFESAIKRGCGIKDMGNILPGHGGILDRFDSMLFASASIVVCFMTIV